MLSFVFEWGSTVRNQPVNPLLLAAEGRDGESEKEGAGDGEG